VRGSGISWVVCKSAPCSRQTTTPAPHHSVFYRPDALPADQPMNTRYDKWWLVMYVHKLRLQWLGSKLKPTLVNTALQCSGDSAADVSRTETRGQSVTPIDRAPRCSSTDVTLTLHQYQHCQLTSSVGTQTAMTSHTGCYCYWTCGYCNCLAKT